MNTQSENIAELATALSKAQAEIQPAIKDSNNPYFKSKYADLSSVWNSCRDPLTRNGLAVIQTMDTEDGKLMLVTTLAHSSGQWIKSKLPIKPTKDDPQGLGSAITYMRRYGLSSMVGVIADEDDDGNRASAAAPEKAKPKTIGIKEQGDLSSLLDQLPDYKNFIMKKLKDLAMNSISEITPEMYTSMKSEAIKLLSNRPAPQQKIEKVG